MEKKRRFRDFKREAETRNELRTTLESFFRVAEPEQVEEIQERLPVEVEAREEAKAEPSQFIMHVDWPKLYDDRVLMQGLTKDLGRILTRHIERQRFEQEEDDITVLMMS